MKHLSFSSIFALAILVILVTAGYFSLPWNKSISTKPGGVACTMDAKLCPDGSSVGRVPPSCRFAPCPGTTAGSGEPVEQPRADATFRSIYGYSIDYPAGWEATEDDGSSSGAPFATFAADSQVQGSPVLVMRSSLEGLTEEPQPNLARLLEEDTFGSGYMGTLEAERLSLTKVVDNATTIGYVTRWRLRTSEGTYEFQRADFMAKDWQSLFNTSPFNSTRAWRHVWFQNPEGFEGGASPAIEAATFQRLATSFTVADWQRYGSDLYRFSLNLPSSWEGYHVKITQGSGYGLNGSSGYTNFCFYFAGEIRPCLLKIMSFTPAQWEGVSAKGKQSLSERFTAGDGSVYALDYSAGCAQLDEFQCARSREVPSIFRTFKFLGEAAAPPAR